MTDPLYIHLVIFHTGRSIIETGEDDQVRLAALRVLKLPVKRSSTIL